MPLLKRNLIANVLVGFSLMTTPLLIASEYQQLTIEEQRIEKAKLAMPLITSQLAKRVDDFTDQISKANNFTVLTQLVIRHGNGVWEDALVKFKQNNDFDDRALYWARLQMSEALRSSTAFKQLLPHQQKKLLWKYELLSRGQQSITFDKKADKKILLTGFDPFFLDRNIKQSNPSGVIAMSLDNVVLSLAGETAEIEVLIVPVRFADFDQGMIEELLTPYIKSNDIDMVVTVSMGRENFDLERFPALRRSAKAPDNLNVLTGADTKSPQIPLLKGASLAGPEFVEFSLPVDTMKNAPGRYKINDNHAVATLSAGEFDAKSLNEISSSTSVKGSGGGYLSNEISYRSILLRDKYQPLLPVGHIHTPRIKTFEPKTLSDIVNQTKQMITLAISKI